MYRLTTPTHEFVMDIDPNEWCSFIVSYSQHGAIILEKTDYDNYDVETADDGSYILTLKLTQEETKLFNAKENAYVQIRCLYDNGDTLASDKICFKVEDVINQTVMQ